MNRRKRDRPATETDDARQVFMIRVHWLFVAQLAACGTPNTTDRRTAPSPTNPPQADPPAQKQDTASARPPHKTLDLDAPAGPAPAWSYALPARPTQLLGREDGWAVARTLQLDQTDAIWTLTAIRDGTKLWENHEPTEWMADLGARGLAVGFAGTIRRLDPKVGTARGPIDIKRVESAELDARTATGRRDAVSVFEDAAHGLYGVTERSLRRLVRPTDATLPDFDSFLSGGAHLWLADGSDVHLLDASWHLQATIGAHEGIESILVDEQGATLAMDGALVRLDPSACTARDRITVPGWRGSEDDDRCWDCSPAPRGCILWSKSLPDELGATAEERELSVDIIAGAPGTIVFSDRVQTRAVAVGDGSDLWSTPTRAFAETARTAEGDVLAVSAAPTTWRLWSLNGTTGAPNWVIERPAAQRDERPDAYDVTLQVAGRWVFAAYGPDLIALVLPDT